MGRYTDVSDAFTRTVDQAAQEHKSDQRKLDQARDRALDRADRREWAHKRRGDERRWRD